mmetsp:Transcript_12814/g.38700  ORF Transcript_12814/g.38700 Transcript_12814/m.38700 type:complete len:226 (+) Transcript_12814:558-1235(+)
MLKWGVRPRWGWLVMAAVHQQASYVLVHSITKHHGGGGEVGKVGAAGGRLHVSLIIALQQGRQHSAPAAGGQRRRHHHCHHHQRRTHQEWRSWVIRQRAVCLREACEKCCEKQGPSACGQSFGAKQCALDGSLFSFIDIVGLDAADGWKCHAAQRPNGECGKGLPLGSDQAHCQQLQAGRAQPHCQHPLLPQPLQHIPQHHRLHQHPAHAQHLENQCHIVDCEVK